MTGMRMFLIGLWVAAVGGWLALAGCEKAPQTPKPEAKSPPAEAKSPPAEAKPAAKAPEPAPEEPLPPDLIQIKAEITRAKAQLDMTTAKLEVLVASTGDLDQPSEEAIAAIQALDAETKELKKRGDNMRERGAAYFETWEKQLENISTPAVRELATKRRDELTAKYTELLTAMQEARAALDPLWADLEAIQTSIEDGLSPEKLKELAPQVKKVKEASAGLKGRIDLVYTKVDDVAAIYTQP